MPSDKIKCTSLTAAGKPCNGWAINGSIPPRCAPHSGLAGAPKGNTNAVTHGFYQKCVTEEEVSAVFAGAEDVTLIQEAILIRVVLRRLMNYLGDKDTPPEKITAVAPLIFTGSRAVAYIEKHLPIPMPSTGTPPSTSSAKNGAGISRCFPFIVGCYLLFVICYLL